MNTWYNNYLEFLHLIMKASWKYFFHDTDNNQEI